MAAVKLLSPLLIGAWRVKLRSMRGFTSEQGRERKAKVTKALLRFEKAFIPALELGKRRVLPGKEYEA